MHSKNLNLLITGGAGFIGSNLTLALQEKFPDARLTVIDDFRSGDFKNLRGYRGDFVAADMSRLDWREQFGDPATRDSTPFFISPRSPTRTDHDQFPQMHDNVESFRRLLFRATEQNANRLRLLGVHLRRGQWREQRET